MPITRFAAVPEPPPTVLELPARGFPISEDGLSVWFRQKHGRDASERELGAIMARMAERDGGHTPEDPKPVLGGWAVLPQGAPGPDEPER